MLRTLLCLLVLASPSYAQGIKTGNTLLAECRSESEFKQAICLGFIMGAAEALLVFKHAVPGQSELFCNPPSVTTGQLQDIVIFWLEDNPVERHNSASALILLAMRDAFPC